MDRPHPCEGQGGLWTSRQRKRYSEHLIRMLREKKGDKVELFYPPILGLTPL
jgi:hypothetical protein